MPSLPHEQVPAVAMRDAWSYSNYKNDVWNPDCSCTFLQLYGSCCCWCCGSKIQYRNWLTDARETHGHLQKSTYKPGIIVLVQMFPSVILFLRPYLFSIYISLCRLSQNLYSSKLFLICWWHYLAILGLLLTASNANYVLCWFICSLDIGRTTIKINIAKWESHLWHLSMVVQNQSPAFCSKIHNLLIYCLSCVSS